MYSGFLVVVLGVKDLVGGTKKRSIKLRLLKLIARSLENQTTE